MGVIDDAGEVVGRRAVRLDQDLVLEGVRLDRDGAVDEVVVGDGPAGGDAEEDGVAVLVGTAGGDELGGLGPVDVEAAGLEKRLLVPVEAEPAEVVEDLVEEARLGALEVRVLDDLRWLGLDWDEEPLFQSRP
ncbi:MAG TPA: hypothetical protein PLP83_08770, partial [Candidatus Aminicenantes bacterium]|nr:hypothetical protein [Candidatus Aminicenantes bacterium]